VTLALEFKTVVTLLPDMKSQYKWPKTVSSQRQTCTTYQMNELAVKSLGIHIQQYGTIRSRV